jgi:hypothetical protein
MPSFFVQGPGRVEPAINPQFAHSIVREALEPYGDQRRRASTYARAAS